MSTTKPILLVCGTPPEEWFDLIAPAAGHVEIRRAGTTEETEAMLGEAEIVFAWEKGARWIQEHFAKADKLKWVQTSSAGLERILFPALIESPVVLTNGRGLYASALAEFVMFSVLFFTKNFRRLERNRPRRIWDHFVGREVRGQTLVIVGYGGTGRATAKLARAFGMKVLAVKRNASVVEGSQWVDEVVPLERWHGALKVADFVVNALPLTPATRGMFGEEEFRAMKTSAVYISVGRGKTTQEALLIEALKQGWIAGAGLDVFENEPLEPASELWDLPSVILSPHCTDITPAYHTESAHLLRENIQRYIRGEPLLNLVEDKRRGY